MKTILSLFFSFAIISAATAQDDKPISSGSFTINAGLSVPVGSYGSATATDPYAGYASSGLELHLMFQKPIRKSHWGFAVELGGGDNPFDSYTFLRTNFKFDPSVTAYINATNYSYGYFLTGALITVPLKKASFDVRIMGGLLSLSSPYVIMTASDSYTGELQIITINETSGQAFAFSAGADVRFMFSKHVTGIIGLDFMRANPTLSTMEESYDNYSVPETMVYYITTDQPTGVIAFTAGIGLRIGKSTP